ncbi:MAG: hypothetical protein ACTHXI_07505, partial [Halomonadaceae bacterium]
MKRQGNSPTHKARKAPLTLAVALAGLMASAPLYAQTAAPATDDVKAGEQAMAEFSALEQATGERAPATLPSLPGLFAKALDNDADLSRQRYELEATREEVPI